MSPTAVDAVAAELPPTVARFLKLTGELSELLARETALLEGSRPREAKALAGEKARLTAEYRSALSVLRASEEQLLGPKGSAVRAAVRDATDRFREELARHARLVVRLKGVTEGIVRAIVEETAKTRDPVRRYGGNARVAPRSRPASLTLDENI